MTRGRRVVVGYARTTGYEESEAADPAQLIKAQVEAIQVHCRRHGWLLAKVYVDRGIPGQPKSTRTGIFALLDEIPLLGTTDIVVVKVERIIRDGEIGRQILKEIDDHNLKIHSLSEDASKVREDTKRITGSTVAALKSATTKIRALRQGKAPAGRAPLGYKREADDADETSRLVVVEDEAKIVTWIFEEYLRQRSIGKVADELNERKIPPPYGTIWSRASVAWILRNEVYIGTVKFGTIKAKGEHTPLISLAVFERVQELRKQNRRRGRIEASDKGQHIALEGPTALPPDTEGEDDDVDAADVMYEPEEPDEVSKPASPPASRSDGAPTLRPLRYKTP